MEQLILVVHLVVALTIIGLILLQRGKGADVGASFGGGASQTVFGSSGGGNVLTDVSDRLVVGYLLRHKFWFGNDRRSAFLGKR